MERIKIISDAADRQEDCADFIVRQYVSDDYRVQKLSFEESGSRGIAVQIQNTSEGFLSGVKKLTGLGTCATLKLEKIGDDLKLSVGEGRWLDKAALAGLSMVVLAPLLISSTIGAVMQKKLLDKVFVDALGFFSGAR